jgi:hypothetical protein
MERDPTANGNNLLTLRGANRLAFEALRFFPCLPARSGMVVRGWRATGGNWQDGCRVRWPLWDKPIAVPVVGGRCSDFAICGSMMMLQRVTDCAVSESEPSWSRAALRWVRARTRSTT